MIKCPYCKEGNLVIAQDAVVTYAMYEQDGVLRVAEKIYDIAYQDETWVECQECHKGNFDGADDPDGLLQDIFDKAM